MLSLRQLWGNTGLATPDNFPGRHPYLVSLCLVAAILAVFAPLAIARYRRVTTR